MLLLDENMSELFEAASLAKKAGADYFVVKPFTPHPKGHINFDLDYTDILQEKETLALQDDKFKVIIRKNAMSKKQDKKPYKACYGYSFWSYLASNGDLYACSAFLGDKKFTYGNVYNDNLKDIYDKNHERITKLMSEVDVEKCWHLCRFDEINKYLWDLKNPHPHVNFI